MTVSEHLTLQVLLDAMSGVGDAIEARDLDALQEHAKVVKAGAVWLPGLVGEIVYYEEGPLETRGPLH